MTRPFLILQLRPEDATADNELAAIQHYGKLAADEVHRYRLEQGPFPAIDLDAYAAIIVGGSPFDVSKAETEKSPVQKQIENGFQQLFDAIVAQDFPFLGCCSGNGLLGKYCGTEISSRYGEAVGGVDIQLTEAGKQDALLAGMPERIRVLTGHKEACDELPPGCVLLATNTTCPIQMFRLHRNIYATQFHPEADLEGFRVRVEAYKHHGYFPAEEADALIQRVAREQTPFAQEILRRFVIRYRYQ